MKTAALLILAVLVTAFSIRATALSVQENTIALTPVETQQCVDGGGCFVISRKVLQEFSAEIKRRSLIECRNAL